MIEVYTDAACKIRFGDMGSVSLYDKKDIPFFIRNTGPFRLEDVSIETTYPETEIVGNIRSNMLPGETIGYMLKWQPGKKTLEMAEKKQKREGKIIVKATEIIE